MKQTSSVGLPWLILHLTKPTPTAQLQVGVQIWTKNGDEIKAVLLKEHKLT